MKGIWAVLWSEGGVKEVHLSEDELAWFGKNFTEKFHFSAPFLFCPLQCPHQEQGPNIAFHCHKIHTSL